MYQTPLRSCFIGGNGQIFECHGNYWLAHMEKLSTLQSELAVPLKHRMSQIGELLIALTWVFLRNCSWLLSNSYQNDVYKRVN